MYCDEFEVEVAVNLNHCSLAVVVILPSSQMPELSVVTTAVPLGSGLEDDVLKTIRYVP